MVTAVRVDTLGTLVWKNLILGLVDDESMFQDIVCKKHGHNIRPRLVHVRFPYRPDIQVASLFLLQLPLSAELLVFLVVVNVAVRDWDLCDSISFWCEPF